MSILSVHSALFMRLHHCHGQYKASQHLLWHYAAMATMGSWARNASQNGVVLSYWLTLVTVTRLHFHSLAGQLQMRFVLLHRIIAGILVNLDKHRSTAYGGRATIGPGLLRSANARQV